MPVSGILPVLVAGTYRHCGETTTLFTLSLLLSLSCLFAETVSIGASVSASGSGGASLGTLNGDGRSPGAAGVSGERSPIGRRRGPEGNAAQGEPVYSCCCFLCLWLVRGVGLGRVGLGWLGLAWVALVWVVCLILLIV